MVMGGSCHENCHFGGPNIAVMRCLTRLEVWHTLILGKLLLVVPLFVCFLVCCLLVVCYVVSYVVCCLFFCEKKSRLHSQVGFYQPFFASCVLCSDVKTKSGHKSNPCRYLFVIFYRLLGSLRNELVFFFLFKLFRMHAFRIKLSLSRY